MSIVYLDRRREKRRKKGGDIIKKIPEKCCILFIILVSSHCLDYVVIGFDMEVQPLVTHNAA